MALLTNIDGKFSVSDAGAIRFNNAFTFPTADGTANYVLKTNGSGQLSWGPDNDSGDITGSGTANAVTKFTGTKTIGDGPITFSSNNSTFAGDVYTTGTSNSNVVISRDNMYVDAGQLYIGADDSTTDDSFRQRTASGSYFIESRKSGTWTNRLQINTAGTLIGSQGATFSGQVSATHFDSTSTTANIFLGSVITKPGDNLGFIVRNDSNAVIGSLLRTSNTTSKLTTDNLSLGGTTAQYVRGDGSFATYSGGGGTVTGTGVANKVAYWTSATNIDDGPITFSGNNSTFAGYIKLGAYSYIGEDLSDLDSLTIASDHTEAIHFAHFTPATGTYSTNMIINNSGNVGIGTTLPAGKLHVVNNSQSTAAITVCNEANGGDGFVFQKWQYVESTSNFRLDLKQRVTSGVVQYAFDMVNNGTGYTSVLVLDRGNVGIGTTSPQMGLHVADTKGALFGPSGSGAASMYFSPSDENTLNGSYGIDTDSADIWLNYRGYQDGFTRFRDTRIGNGKGGLVALFNGSTGNVGIGTSSPTNYKLEVNGNVKGDSFGTDQSTTARIFAPSGAAYNGSGNQTGYLIIKLPDNGANGVNNMMSGLIRVFDYAGNESFDVHFAGYWYSGYNWTNCTAWIESQSNIDRNFNVRFGAMTGAAGSGTRPYITIGEGDSTWSYCKFSVMEYTSGHSNAALYKWNSGWEMALSSTAPGVTARTATNCQGNNWARNGQDVYYGSGTGNVGIGATSPGYKLEVSGNMRSSTVTVYDGMGGTETGIGASAAGGYLRLYTGGVNRATVQSTAETMVLFGLDTTGSNYLQFRDSAGTAQGYIGYGASASDEYYIVQFKSAPINFYINSAVRGSISTGGTLTMGGDIVAYGSPSDKRLKQNIKPIKSALNKVSKLQGVTFDWKDKKQEYDQYGKPQKLQEWKNDIGFIAQDVQKVLPELVRENEDGMLSMRHQGIAPILLEAIKELKAEIEELKLNNCNCK